MGPLVLIEVKGPCFEWLTSSKKKVRWVLGRYTALARPQPWMFLGSRRDDKLPRYVGITINHEIRIPIKPVYYWKARGFFILAQLFQSIKAFNGTESP